MTSTTASSQLYGNRAMDIYFDVVSYLDNPKMNIPNEIAGTIRSWIHTEQPPWGYDYRQNYTYEQFRMRRLGSKEYGFVYMKTPDRLVARYNCSWPEAQRRFKLLLITRRLAGWK